MPELGATQKILADVGLGRAASIGAEISRLTALNPPAFDFVTQMVADQTRWIQRALEATRISGLSPVTQAFGAVGGARSYLEDLRRVLHVPNPAVGLVALATAEFAARQRFDRSVMDQVAALRPGYQMSAVLGFSGSVQRGVAADILRRYNDIPNPATPVFTAALRTAHVADASEAGADQIEELWATIHELRALVRTEKDPVRRYSLLEIMSFIGMLLSLLLSGAALYGDYQSRLADEADHEQQVQFEAEMRQERAEARAEAAERFRSTRYIANDGPLRREPGARAPVLQIVYAGQMAVAKDQRDGWVLVEVFSYAPEQSVVGWIPSRRLRSWH